jgi:hypothetical protein
MWSSRKYSVFRHISTVHGGNGLLVPFMDYLVGRISGIYPSGTPPVGPFYQRKGKDFDPFTASYEEFWKETGREMAQKFHSRLSSL